MATTISMRDENGKPIRVFEDNGFVEVTRPFDEETDGWMEDQLDTSDFVAIQIGADTSWLVSQVNRLKRENYHLKQEVKMWQKAAGIGA